MSVADSSQSEKLTPDSTQEQQLLIEELHKNIKFNYPELFSDDIQSLRDSLLS